MNTLALSLLSIPFLLATACTADGPREQFEPQLRAGVSYDDAQACDVDTACPSGLDCVVFDAVETPICASATTICDDLDCGSGECLVLESYPAQIVCEGPAGGAPDGDDDDSTQP